MKKTLLVIGIILAVLVCLAILFAIGVCIAMMITDKGFVEILQIIWAGIKGLFVKKPAEEVSAFIKLLGGK